MERPDTRLLSSLRDLKLRNQSSICFQEEGKRNSKRQCPIKPITDDEEIYENFTIIEKRKNLLDISLLVKSLSNHFTFSSLISDKALRNSLIEQFRLCKVEKDCYLMEQNDNASSFFILHEGELQVQVNEKLEGKIRQGEGFGELALLYSSPRSASILALKTSFLWFIDRVTFRSIVSTMIEKASVENKKFITHNKFFTYLTDSQRNKIVSIAITQRYEAGQKICKEGELASAMYIIKSGKLKRTLNSYHVGFYVEGQFLEEYATLSKNSFRKQTIIAQTDCQLIALGVEEIERALGKSLPIIIIRNKAKESLMNEQIFKKLSREHIEKIIDCFTIRKVQKDDYAFKKGQLCKNKILFAIQGAHSLEKQEKKIQIFGASSLFEKLDAKFEADCLFSTEGKVAEATVKSIEKALGCSFLEAVERSISLQKVMQIQKSKLKNQKENAKKYSLRDFFVIRKLGQGQFGQVFLVTDYQHSNYYALKCISKSQTIKYRLEKHLVNEKTVLESHESPFIVDFIRSFKDKKYIYFLMEFINGVELFDALRIIGLVSGELARFYTAILLQALESLHKNGIVYRDLKPENVIVGKDGYLKIIDMGTCKNLKSSATKKTFTIIGTPNYMAPEILSGKGYSYGVDLWSLGIILFQFLSGFLPFGENCDDPYEIYEDILKNQVKFPKYMKDQISNSFITQLLSRNPEARLGQSYSQLKNHMFFSSIEWDQLLQKRINPSFKPPKDSVMKMENIPKDLKPVDHFLKHVSPQGPKRYDLNANWDSCF